MTNPILSAVSRRAFIVTAAAASVIRKTDGLAAPNTAALRKRPDISSAAGQKMAKLYAAAVTAMQNPALQYPPQPTSWTFQAYIHGVPVNPFDPANSNGLIPGTTALKTRIDEIYGMPAAGSPQAHWKKAAQDCWATCTHSSPYFTVWHRWYMYYFERICRKMSGDESFMLPFWNYGSDMGDSLKLPAVFQNSSSFQSLIFDDRGLGFASATGSGAQNVAMNNGGYMPFSQSQYNDALAAIDLFPSDINFAQPPQQAYFAFGLSGRLECVPHDLVHNNVGGWMGNVPSAAGDPIFYMHHCQIDRLFASWEAEQGRVYNWGNDPTKQPAEAPWKNHESWFADEKGGLVKVKMGDALSTKALGYEYETLAAPEPQVATAATPRAEASERPRAVVVAAMASGKLRVGGTGASVALQPAPGVRAEAAVPGGGSILVLKNLKLVRRPPAPLNVFLNLPAGAQPDISGPYWVGTINLFNVPIGDAPAVEMDGMKMGGPVDVRFDVGTVLARQKADKLWDGRGIDVTVTTAGVAGAPDTTYLTFDGVTLQP